MNTTGMLLRRAVLAASLSIGATDMALAVNPPQDPLDQLPASMLHQGTNAFHGSARLSITPTTDIGTVNIQRTDAGDIFVAAGHHFEVTADHEHAGMVLVDWGKGPRPATVVVSDNTYRMETADHHQNFSLHLQPDGCIQAEAHGMMPFGAYVMLVPE